MNLLFTTSGCFFLFSCCFFLRLDQCNTDSGGLPGVLGTLCPQSERGDADEVCTADVLLTHWLSFLCWWLWLAMPRAESRGLIWGIQCNLKTLNTEPWLILYSNFQRVLISNLFLALNSNKLFMNSPHLETSCELHCLLLKSVCNARWCWAETSWFTLSEHMKLRNG